jgi:hypothetical protein
MTWRATHVRPYDPEVGPILMRVHSILSQVAEQRTNPGTTEEDAM